MAEWGELGVVVRGVAGVATVVGEGLSEGIGRDGDARETEMGGGGARRGGRGGGDVRRRTGNPVVAIVITSVCTVFVISSCTSCSSPVATPTFKVKLRLQVQLARTSSCLLNIFSTSTLKNVASSNASLSLPLLVTKSSCLSMTMLHADSGGVHKSPSS